MSRKHLLVLAVLLIAALMVAACGGGDAPAEEAAAPAEEVAATTAPPAESSGAAPAAEEAAQDAGKGTLGVVQERGKLICGVNQAVPGFGFLQTDGSFAGFDIDYCRALAAATLGDPEAVEYRPLTAKDRFTALSGGEIDVLIRNTTWTLTRDTDLAGNFVATTFYDGQGIQVRVDSGISTLADLEGAAICVQQGTTTELNLADQLAAAGVNYTPVVFETADDTTNAYLEDRCDAWTTDISGIVARQSIFDVPEDHTIMETVLSKEPLGPMVRHGDDQWFDIMQWVVFTTFAGEEMGIGIDNVDSFMDSEDPNIRKLLGQEGEMGQKLGLGNDWSYNVLKQVGNYADIYNRNLGPDTPMNVPRGLNSSWVDGGLLYAPPVR